MLRNKIIFTIDVEPDLHTLKYRGIEQGLVVAEELFDKYNIKPVLFVTGDCIKKYPSTFKRLYRKGWEISSHGYTHRRFDEMSKHEKEKEIKKIIVVFKKYLGIKPKGFRAPQHSIDKETLNLLEKYGFKYDSSITPLNLLQLLFFPSKFLSWLKTFFSPLNPYKIRKDLVEIPTSALLLPFVSLIVRIFPPIFLKVYIFLIKLFYKNPVFYCHSWDFIELPHSKIEKLFPYTKLIKNLEYVLKSEK